MNEKVKTQHPETISLHSVHKCIHSLHATHSGDSTQDMYITNTPTCPNIAYCSKELVVNQTLSFLID